MPGAAWRSATGRSRAVQRQQALRSGVGGPIAGCHQGCAPCRWPRTSSAPVATVPGHPRGQVPLELAGRYPLASAILGRTSRLWTLGALGRLVVVTGPPKHCGSFLSRAGAYGRHQSAEDRAAWARPARGRRPCGGVRRAEQFLQSESQQRRAQLRGQISSGIFCGEGAGYKNACPLIVKYHVPHTPTYNTRSSFHRRAVVAEAASSKR